MCIGEFEFELGQMAAGLGGCWKVVTVVGVVVVRVGVVVAVVLLEVVLVVG